MTVVRDAIRVLTKYDLPYENIPIECVPECFSIPLAVQIMAQALKCDAILAVGFLSAKAGGSGDESIYTAKTAIADLGRLQLKLETPIVAGIVTVLMNNQKSVSTRYGTMGKGKHWADMAYKLGARNKQMRPAYLDAEEVLQGAEYPSMDDVE